METFAIVLLLVSFFVFFCGIAGMIFGDIMSEWPVGAMLAGCTAALVACVIGSAAASSSEHAEHERLMAQCIQDGKKEYECVSLLKKPESTVTSVPIIIPIR